MNNIFIFVEGMDDLRFINNIINPYVLKKEMNLIPITFQQKTHRKIRKDIKTYLSQDYDFIFLSDLDSKYYPCISSRKEKRKEEYTHLPLKNIIIVKEEIESWYLAGINNSIKEFEELEMPDNTETISKEDFQKIIENSNFDSKINFFNEVSKNYDLDLAMKRNKSLRYFINKINSIATKNN